MFIVSNLNIRWKKSNMVDLQQAMIHRLDLLQDPSDTNLTVVSCDM